MRVNKLNLLAIRQEQARTARQAFSAPGDELLNHDFVGRLVFRKLTCHENPFGPHAVFAAAMIAWNGCVAVWDSGFSGRLRVPLSGCVQLPICMSSLRILAEMALARTGLLHVLANSSTLLFHITGYWEINRPCPAPKSSGSKLKCSHVAMTRGSMANSLMRLMAGPETAPQRIRPAKVPQNLHPASPASAAPPPPSPSARRTPPDTSSDRTGVAPRRQLAFRRLADTPENPQNQVFAVHLRPETCSCARRVRTQ